jgi:hypothetical protein
MPSTVLCLTASACLTLAVAVPTSAQGKSGGKRPAKTATPPPSTSALSAPTGSQLTVASTSPFSWLDDASILGPGNLSLGVSLLRWHGAGMSETIFPVIDAAIGLTPRVQFSANVPRVAGGFGTTFFSAKLGLLQDEDRGLYVAVSPTLEIVGGEVSSAIPGGDERAHWGLPASVHFDREQARLYASSGYFSPGIWYAGAGLATAIGDRVGLSGSFSRAWASASSLATVASPHRTEITGGASVNLHPNAAVFASLSRTLGMTADLGGGTTFGFGVSLSAAVPNR